MVGALGVAAAFAMPALGAPDSAQKAGARRAGPTQIFFTPASADPKLAALIARSGLGSAAFRFTPADSPADSRGVRRPVDLSMSARSAKAGVVTLRGGDINASPVGVAPIAYNLSGTTAAKRLTVPGDAAKIDLGTSPSGRKTLDIGMSLSGRRANSKLKPTNDRPTDADARLTSGVPNESIDVGGSYSLSRNIDVTAGVRYKAQDRDRLAPLPDNRRESQAVYVGTAFRF
jgi:hypothetical protein